MNIKDGRHTFGDCGVKGNQPHGKLFGCDNIDFGHIAHHYPCKRDAEKKKQRKKGEGEGEEDEAAAAAAADGRGRRRG